MYRPFNKITKGLMPISIANVISLTQISNIYFKIRSLIEKYPRISARAKAKQPIPVPKQI